MRLRSRTTAAKWSPSWVVAVAGALAWSACATAPVAPPAEPTPDPQGDVALLTAPLRLVNPRLACGIAMLRFMRGDELIAVLGPDEHVELVVPVGHYVITVDDGRGRLDHPVDVGAEGATLWPGCLPDPYGGPFGGPRLNPLTLIGPDATCGLAGVRARAGGLLVELGVGERQTLFLPAATHIVRILGDSEAGRKSRDATVDLTAGGAELPLVQCEGTAATP